MVVCHVDVLVGGFLPGISSVGFATGICRIVKNGVSFCVCQKNKWDGPWWIVV